LTSVEMHCDMRKFAINVCDVHALQFWRTGSNFGAYLHVCSRLLLNTAHDIRMCLQMGALQL